MGNVEVEYFMFSREIFIGVYMINVNKRRSQEPPITTTEYHKLKRTVLIGETVEKTTNLLSTFLNF